jgi:hypothetical protein
MSLGLLAATFRKAVLSEAASSVTILCAPALSSFEKWGGVAAGELRVFKVKRRSNDRPAAAGLVRPSHCVFKLPNHSGNYILEVDCCLRALMPCDLQGGYQHFRGTYLPHLQRNCTHLFFHPG